MKAIAKISVIVAITIFIGGSCEKNEVTPCVKGIPVQSVGNCYLLIQVLNAPIGKSYTYQPPSTANGQQPQTYSNAIATSLTLKNVNQGDTVYFKYKFGATINCGVQNALFGPPGVPIVEVLSYSLKRCE